MVNLKVGEGVKLITVCSGKGGTGKSCISAYTASALAAMKKKTLLIDAGSAPGTLDVILGVQDAAVFNLEDVLGGVCELQKAILPVPKHENLFLLPAGIPPSKSGIPLSLHDLLRGIRYDYDFVVIDNPDFSLIEAKTSSAILLVTTPDTLSVRAAAQKCRVLYGMGALNIRLVVNNVPARVIPMKSFVDFDDIIDQVGARLIAVIPASQKLHYSANNGLPLSPESLTLQVFHRLGERVRGKQAPLLVR